MSNQVFRILQALFVGAVTASITMAQSVKPAEADAEYYPLAAGNTWVYRVRTLEPKPSTSTIKWEVGKAWESDGGMIYALRSSPIECDDDSLNIRVSHDGITDILNEYPLLKFPLKAGSKWSIPRRGTKISDEFSVISVGAACRVGKKEFSDCVVIQEADSENSQPIVVKTYARRVGPVSFRYFRVRNNMRVLVQEMELLSCQLHAGTN